MGVGLESIGVRRVPAADFAHQIADRGAGADIGAVRIGADRDGRNKNRLPAAAAMA